jgi:Uma2 family endonuclease
VSETDWHYNVMKDLRDMLEAYFADDPDVYVSGNLLVFYEPGNRRKHLSPDVLVVKGVRKKWRRNYLTWQEGKGLDLVIELTSQSTRDEDREDKFELYQNILRVPEYFLFDPLAEYLEPTLQGYRLQGDRYVPIRSSNGGLPSEVLGLHLTICEDELRFYNPTTGQYLPTPAEMVEREATARHKAESARQSADAERLKAEAAREMADAERLKAEAAREMSDAERLKAEAARELAEAQRLRAEAEADRLRRELEGLRRRAEEAS